jgi:hypothetical protein
VPATCHIDRRDRASNGQRRSLHKPAELRRQHWPSPSGQLSSIPKPFVDERCMTAKLTANVAGAGRNRVMSTDTCTTVELHGRTAADDQGNAGPS